MDHIKQTYCLLFIKVHTSFAREQPFILDHVERYNNVLFIMDHIEQIHQMYGRLGPNIFPRLPPDTRATSNVQFVLKHVVVF